MGRQADRLTGAKPVAFPPVDATTGRTEGREPWPGFRLVTEKISTTTTAAWVLCIYFFFKKQPALCFHLLIFASF